MGYISNPTPLLSIEKPFSETLVLVLVIESYSMYLGSAASVTSLILYFPPKHIHCNNYQHFCE